MVDRNLKGWVTVKGCVLSNLIIKNSSYPTHGTGTSFHFTSISVFTTTLWVNQSMMIKWNVWLRWREADTQETLLADICIAPCRSDATCSSPPPCEVGRAAIASSLHRSKGCEWSNPRHMAVTRTQQWQAPASNIRIPADSATTSLECRNSSAYRQVQVQTDIVWVAATIACGWLMYFCSGAWVSLYLWTFRALVVEEQYWHYQ